MAQSLDKQHQYWQSKVKLLELSNASNLLQATDLTLALETLDMSIKQDDQATEDEIDKLMMELASVEQSLSTLQKKNFHLKLSCEEKKKTVIEQKRILDQRDVQMDALNGSVSLRS